MTQEPDRKELVEVRNLTKHFPVRRGVLRRQVGAIRAVDGVTFNVRRGETLGLVGESGSGKSTLARVLLRLAEPTSGEVVFDGVDITKLDRRALRAVRPRMQMIFQDPYASLNPRLTAGAAVLEAMEVNRMGDHAWRRVRLLELFELVGLQAKFIHRYSHELSGGQRQRVGIARALATDPDFLVADEAISALDVSIQAQIVNLLRDLGEELGLTYLFITHDISMVRFLSDRIVVLYLGRIAEMGETAAVCRTPLHPYTLALLSAVPIPDPERESMRQRIVLPGDVPDPAHPPPGCRFRTRCPFATETCRDVEPELRTLDIAGDRRLVACHHAERINADKQLGEATA